VGKDGRVINRVGVTSSNQVNLRVRIAEISRDVEKQLGFNWQFIGEAFGINTAFSFVNPFVGIGAVADAVGISHKNSGRDVNTVISALEEEGLINILAEPNLTALSGETASFLAGGEFPILVPDEDRIVVEFKKFGVSLAFTPTVLSDGQINLHVRPEVSRLTSEGAVNLPLNSNTVITVPALSVRRAETTVELGSGQSFAIGGLLNNDVAHDIHKVPGLGDVPIIGRLFTSDRFRRNESELVIIVTPYLVRPSPQRLALPNDGFQPPNDLERLFPGGTWKRNPAPAPTATVRPDGSRLAGPVGFALD
jgi:pilus assembly protein CpaC